mmetsp:Transcript_24747/g.71426  ORF Transcript_24747/g.71426 Transcript_24747/m.71426 type:complete len:734 (-) Transcript_24747:1101-3302(-)
MHDPSSVSLPRWMMAVLYFLIVLGGWLLCCVAERTVPASMAFLHRTIPTHINANQRDRSAVAWRRVRRLKTATRLVLMSEGTATSGQLPVDAVVAPLGVRGKNDVEIEAGDLISVDRLTEPIDRGLRLAPSVALDLGQQQPYIGQGRLDKISQELVGHYEARDEDRAIRVPPMVVTRFSRGGKTRLMKQIALGLQKKDIPALFVTFNEGTKPTDFELSARSPLQSIALRIAWATATPEALDKVAQALGKPAAQVTFSDWVENVSVSRRTIQEWLGSHSLVLFADELNQRIPADTEFKEEPLAKEVADFLTEHFVDKRQRYFVFSSHIATLGNRLESYYWNLSGRDVYKPQIPRVERISDVTESGLCPDTHAGIVSWTGRAPGLLTLMYSEEPPKPDNVRRPFRKMKVPRLDAALAQNVIRTAIEGDGQLLDKLGTWSRFLDVFGDSCTWPPCYLGLACKELGESHEVKSALGEGFAAGLRVIPTLLNQLLDERGSGRRWEGVAGAGVLLRLLHSHLVAIGEAEAALSSAAAQLVPAAVNDGCKFGGVIQSSEPKTLKDLITIFYDKMDPRLAGEPRVSYFVKPKYSSFLGFDFFVFVTERGRLTTIYGGQCKEGPTGPDKDSVAIIKRSVSEALASVAPKGGGPGGVLASFLDSGAGKPVKVYVRAIWLRGDQGQEVKIERLDQPLRAGDEDIGVVPSRAVIQEVIGVSPAQMCPFEWLVEGKDQAGGEGTGA